MLCATTISNIFAVGDCAARVSSGITIRPSCRWGAAIAQGIALGREFTGITHLPLRSPTTSTAQIGPFILTWSGSYPREMPLEKIQLDTSVKWCWHTNGGSVAGFVQMSMLGGTEVFV